MLALLLHQAVLGALLGRSMASPVESGSVAPALQKGANKEIERCTYGQFR
jgi:hypothetical protein